MTDKEPWDSVRLRKKILEHLDSETVFLTVHAAKAQVDDGLDLQDTLHVLRSEVLDSKHTEFHTKTQRWRYGVRERTEDAKNVIVILFFEKEMVIVTVFKVGKNR
ncbi:MAG: hypothetical protein KGI80_05775 [Verrucomicrobiota bacterium]|nr:hypothetical protein [Verrucomicrobiota bacterium]